MAPNDNNKKHFDHLIENVEDKLNLDIDWARAISATEILYLINHAPFLQIITTEETTARKEQAELVEAKSGWTIHDYGDAMSSSPGRYLYGGGYFRVYADDEDDEGGGIVNPKKGTLIKQAFDTAMEMVERAKQHGWKNIKIVDGHPIMLRAAWMAAEKHGIQLNGFTPQKEDYRARALVNLPVGEFERLRHEVQLGNA